MLSRQIFYSNISQAQRQEKDIAHQYSIKIIKVFKANKILNGQKFAVKIIDKYMISRDDNLEK